MLKAQKAYQKAAREGEPLNREELILKYAPKIKYIAQRLAWRLPPHVELEDLISAGALGLIDAIDKFDPTRNIQFQTYAEFRVKGAMLDELRSMDWIPRSVRQKASILEKTYAEIEQEKGRPATEAEVAEALNMAMDAFYDFINCARSLPLLSMDGEDGEGVRQHFLESLTSEREDNPLTQLKKKELKKVLARMIDQLPKSEKIVVSLYYYEELTMKEIGRVLDVTESRVSQIHTQAMLRMRGKLRKLLG